MFVNLFATSCCPHFEIESVSTCDLITLTFDLLTSKWHHGSPVSCASFPPIFILDFTGARMAEMVVTSGAIRRVKLQSKCHHKQTNQSFTGRMPFLLPDQVSEH